MRADCPHLREPEPTFRAGGFMTSRRQSAFTLLVSCAFLFVATFVGSTSGNAQKKSEPKPSPTPNNELLKVEPQLPTAPAKAEQTPPPDANKQQPASDNKQQK